MKINPDFISPCGLYCGVCAIYIAHRDDNVKLKKGLVNVYKGKVDGKGELPDSEDLSEEDIQCRGCLSEAPFKYCLRCDIKNCTREKGYSGCHECDEFPCQYIENFPMSVGKKVILRAIPHWREVGTERWIHDEEARYICPECGNKLFRGVMQCNKCKVRLDLD